LCAIFCSFFNKPLQPGERADGRKVGNALLKNRGPGSAESARRFKNPNHSQILLESYIIILIHSICEPCVCAAPSYKSSATRPTQKFKLLVYIRTHIRHIRCAQRVIVTTPFNKTLSVVLLLDFFIHFFFLYKITIYRPMKYRRSFSAPAAALSTAVIARARHV